MKSKIALSLAVALGLSACAATPSKHAELSACAAPPAQHTASAGCAAAPVAQAPVTPEAPPAVPELANTSVAELERMVAAGDLNAHVELGTRYGLGKGVEKNYDKAIALLKAAADRDDARAQFYMGTVYATGAGVPKDEAVAFLWYERSANQHFPIAEYWVGFMIAYGKGGIQPTWAGALSYLWDSAVQGNAAAAFLLGYAYDKGTDVDRNPKAAAYWYRRADWYHRAESNTYDGKAEYNLSLLIQHGEAEWEPDDPANPANADAQPQGKDAAGVLKIGPAKSK